MMKKTYQSPQIKKFSIDSMNLLLGVSGNNGIPYGGVDEDGSKVPSVRRHSVWDDEDEEEE